MNIISNNDKAYYMYLGDSIKHNIKYIYTYVNQLEQMQVSSRAKTSCNVIIMIGSLYYCGENSQLLIE